MSAVRRDGRTKILGMVLGGLLFGGGYLIYERLRTAEPPAPDPAQLALGASAIPKGCCRRRPTTRPGTPGTIPTPSSLP